MTDRDLEILWPLILSVSKSALRRNGGADEDPADVAAEVAVQLLRTRPERVTTSYIYRIAFSRAVDFLRWRGRIQPVEDRLEASLETRSEDPREPVDFGEAIRSALRIATPTQRRILRACLACGSQAAAARTLRVSKQVVGQRLSSLRFRIRRFRLLQNRTD